MALLKINLRSFKKLQMFQIFKSSIWKALFPKMNKTSKKLVIAKKVKKSKEILSREALSLLSQEELIDKIIRLEAHNDQLRNILQKKNDSLTNSVDTLNRKLDFKNLTKRHVFLKFYYFGWPYHGYSKQENTNNTIEYFIFQALQKCCLIENRETSNYNRCGRTDKGVSAFSQVISIDLRSKLSNPTDENTKDEFPYCLMINRLLPDNIKCYAWSHVSPSASSRFDCSWRTYKYYFPKGNLNINLMQEAARYFIGVHDFRNFCKMDVSNGVVTFEREIKYADIKPYLYSSETTTGYQLYEFIIQGSGFLWHQIRYIMSVLLLIGEEKESPDVIKQLLNIEENPTRPQYQMAEYLPLNLYECSYDEIPIRWNIDDKVITKIVNILQSQWTSYSIKSAIVRDFINDLSKLKENLSITNKQPEVLMSGVKSKTYIPLVSRIRCESLENKIEHFVKRKKLEIVDSEKNSA